MGFYAKNKQTIHANFANENDGRRNVMKRLRVSRFCRRDRRPRFARTPRQSRQVGSC
jgi:hypothetical protein